MDKKTPTQVGGGQQDQVGLSVPTNRQQLQLSSKRNPCPICGRTKDGDCRIGDQMVLCHHGSTHHPPAGLRPGDVIHGQWAYTGDASDGRAATFTLHKPRDNASRLVPVRSRGNTVQLARLPDATAEPPAHLSDGKRINYSPTQWVVVAVDSNGKRHIPHHQGGRGSGAQPWPLWREADALEHGRGKWIAEAEGEKCAAWFRAAGLVGVSQPGHDHTPASIERRYQRLLEGGVAGVLYLADNDPAGAAKAQRCAAAAAAVGLPLLVVPAVEVWPGLPAGGSIDDAPGTAAERAAALLAAIPDAVERHQQQQVAVPRREGRKEQKPRKLGHTRAMRCFDRCVQILSERERNSLRRRARLLVIAKALGLQACINRQDIAQRVLEAKDQLQGNSYTALTAADRLAMEWPEVDWLVPDLLPANDLSIIGGRPKVGKTAVAMAIAAAVLKGQPVAGCEAPSLPRPVILVSDDQGDADTVTAMRQLAINDHQALLWSRRFRLTEQDLDQLLADVARHPGAVVIIDSLRSVARALPYGENDPEIGAVIYDLKAAVMDAGGSLLLIHHCNKGAGLTGVEALSGHNAIAGAANTVLTLHYVEDEKGKPCKEAEQRRLVREGRTGKPLDWVISRTAGSPSFHKIGTYTEWQAQVEEASKQAKREARQTSTQSAVLEALADADGRWLTCREVVEAMGLDWGDRGNAKDPSRVRDALNRLADDGEIRRERAGNQYTFAAASHGTQIVSDTPTASAVLQGNGSERRGQPRQTSAPAACKKGADLCRDSPRHRNRLQGKGAEVVEVSESMSLPLATDGLELVELVRTPAPTGSAWDLTADGDDPAWGPRPAVA